MVAALTPMLALSATRPLRADPLEDRKIEVEQAFDQYMSAKTEDQRTAVIDFLQHFDRPLVAAALIDHILAARTGVEATAYNKLVEGLNPDGCQALLDRLTIEEDAVSKGKLIVALRHCQGPGVMSALAAALDDTRPVPFAAHTSHPCRVCDWAYDELYLKLRSDPRYGLDNSAAMTGIIVEKTPIEERDALIAKLMAQISHNPINSPTTSGTQEN